MYNLFTVSPREELWPRVLGDSSHWQFDYRRQELVVNCEDVGLLGLGKVGDVDYTVEVGIRQHPWVGGVGLYFGLQDGWHEGKPCRKYQLIELREYLKDNPAKAFTLRRESLVVTMAEDGSPRFSVTPVALKIVPIPSRREQILEITVDQRGLTSVRWGGEEVPELVQEAANARFTPRDYVGRFGTFHELSSAVFRNARAMLSERSHP
jgi:hypothetical protein